MNIEQLKAWTTLYDEIDARFTDISDMISMSDYAVYEASMDNLSSAITAGDESFNFVMEEIYQGGSDTYRRRLPVAVMTSDDWKPMVAEALIADKVRREKEKRAEELNRAEVTVEQAKKRLLIAQERAQSALTSAEARLKALQATD